MTLDEMNAIVDGIMGALSPRFHELSARVAVLEQRGEPKNNTSDVPDLRELVNVKLAELQRQCDAHKKHLSNHDSDLGKLKNGLKGFRE